MDVYLYVRVESMGEIKNKFKILVGNPERKRPFPKHTHRE
jgi:hypothetical protein